MQTRIKVIVFIATSAMLLPFMGCGFKGPAGSDLRFDSPSGSGNTAYQRLQPAQAQRPSAVESAIELSEKYAKLSEEASGLRQKAQNLNDENLQLKDDMQSCRSRLERAEKELGEANDLLLEMRIELNNWKSDVLGFRGEIREADKAQLEALLKILKLLGGEVPEANESAPEQDSTPEK